jgi:gamma-glutamylcyclotransferase (GGCT)/AIG2-like uncharacterized protein YtfP
MRLTKTRRWLLALFAVGLLLPPLWLWHNLLSPWGYKAPAHLSVIDPDREHKLFVYGTLTHGWVRRLVTGEQIESTAASLSGFRREGLDLVADPNAVTQGELLSVTPESLRRLDRYERLGIRYERILVPLTSDEQVWVYMRIRADRQ